MIKVMLFDVMIKEHMAVLEHPAIRLLANAVNKEELAEACMVTAAALYNSTRKMLEGKFDEETIDRILKLGELIVENGNVASKAWCDAAVAKAEGESLQ
jgi:hypothetical protein